MKKLINSLTILIILTSLTTISLLLIFPPAKPLLNQNNPLVKDYFGDSFSIVGIGDSLTEGVGDTSGLGGYLPLVEKSLENYYDVSVISTENLGKSGNRVSQLIKRIKDTPDIQSSLKSADVILLTIGGNDLLKVLKDNIFETPSWDTFITAKDKYLVELSELYTLIRSFNKDCPIYHLGIYNPFYIDFSEITEIQEMVDSWNLATESYISEQNNSIFVAIEDLVYYDNILISEDDSFHPNSTGYQLIANEFTGKIINTKYLWQKED